MNFADEVIRMYRSGQNCYLLHMTANSSLSGELLTGWRQSVWIAVTPVLLPMVVTNFLICPAGARVPILAAVIGLVPVQVALLTVLLVLGPGPFWRRWLWHWGWAAALVGSWMAGYYLTFDKAFYDNAGAIVCGLPLFALVVQQPFWVARAVMGWRLVRRESGALPAEAAQNAPTEKLSVRDLLQGMGVIAVTLGCAKIATEGVPDGMQSQVWFGMLLGGTMAMVVVAFAVLPVLWIFSYEIQLESCWGFTGLYALLWIVGIVLLVRNDPPIALTFVLLVICFVVIFGWSLTRLIQFGFQIQRGRG